MFIQILWISHDVHDASLHSPGTDCIEKPLEDKHKLELWRLLDAAGINGAAGWQ
jgi:hypothetical protein